MGAFRRALWGEKKITAKRAATNNEKQHESPPDDDDLIEANDEILKNCDSIESAWKRQAHEMSQSLNVDPESNLANPANSDQNDNVPEDQSDDSRQIMLTKNHTEASRWGIFRLIIAFVPGEVM